MRTNRRMTDSLTVQLQQFIRKGGVSLFQLSKETGLDSGLLSRFMNGERSITLGTADKLTRHLGLRLVRTED